MGILGGGIGIGIICFGGCVISFEYVRIRVL